MYSERILLRTADDTLFHNVGGSLSVLTFIRMVGHGYRYGWIITMWNSAVRLMYVVLAAWYIHTVIKTMKQRKEKEAQNTVCIRALASLAHVALSSESNWNLSRCEILCDSPEVATSRVHLVKRCSLRTANKSRQSCVFHENWTDGCYGRHQRNPQN